MSSRNRECNRLYDFIEQITAIHLILYIHENARIVCEVIFSLSILSLTFGLNRMIYIPRPIHLWNASTGIGIAINHHRIWGIFIGCNPFVCTHNKPGQLGVMQPNGRKTIVDCARTCIGRWRRRRDTFSDGGVTDEMRPLCCLQVYGVGLCLSGCVSLLFQSR